MAYTPPITISPRLIDKVSQISEALGKIQALAALSPRLRKSNRVRTIHGSLAIENNTLSFEQVTAIVAGKKIKGSEREIREVQNAALVYEELVSLRSHSAKDFLKAHGVLMRELVAEAGRYRSGGAGVYQGAKLIHMAPPADRVPYLMQDLFAWLKKTDLHPLLVGAVVHYEIEFIHPFADGNGRMGRLWQTLILSQWKPAFAHVPVETVVYQKQTSYYQALAAADKQADSEPFVFFMLCSLLETLIDPIYNK